MSTTKVIQLLDTKKWGAANREIARVLESKMRRVISEERTKVFAEGYNDNVKYWKLSIHVGPTGVNEIGAKFNNAGFKTVIGTERIYVEVPELHDGWGALSAYREACKRAGIDPDTFHAPMIADFNVIGKITEGRLNEAPGDHLKVGDYVRRKRGPSGPVFGPVFRIDNITPSTDAGNWAAIASLSKQGGEGGNDHEYLDALELAGPTSEDAYSDAGWVKCKRCGASYHPLHTSTSNSESDKFCDTCAAFRKEFPQHVKEARELSVPEKHQLKIAKQTLNMPDAMVGVMGGPDKKEAREIVKRLTGKVVKEDEDFDEPSEPDEEDITTHDHEHFFYFGRQIASSVPELKAWMRSNNWYPTIWFISDHGNAHVTNIDESFKSAQASIASKEGVSKKRAGAILASASRNASPAAKAKNPNLKKVKEDTDIQERPCPECGGAGDVKGKECAHCDGQGVVRESYEHIGLDPRDEGENNNYFVCDDAGKTTAHYDSFADACKAAQAMASRLGVPCHVRNSKRILADMWPHSPMAMGQHDGPYAHAVAEAYGDSQDAQIWKGILAKTKCPDCKGKGYVEDGTKKCARCNGSGEVQKSSLKEGRDREIRYQVQIYSAGHRYTPAAWDVRFPYGPVKSGEFAGKTGLGKPTDANLAKYVKDFESGTQPGGPNDHLGVVKVTAAEITDTRTREIVARYKA